MGFLTPLSVGSRQAGRPAGGVYQPLSLLSRRRRCCQIEERPPARQMPEQGLYVASLTHHLRTIALSSPSPSLWAPTTCE